MAALTGPEAIPTNTRARRPRPRLFWPVLAAAALIAVHLSLAVAASWQERLLASLPGAAAVFAGWTYITDRKNYRLPFLEYALVQTYVFWGLPVLLGPVSDSLPVPDSAMTTALIAIVVALATLIVTFPIGSRFGRALRKPLTRLLPASPGPAAGPLSLAWLGLAVLVQAGLVLYLPEALQYPARAFGSMYPVLTYLALRKHQAPTARNRTIFLSGLLLLSAAGMFSGRMSYALTPLVLAGVLEFLLDGNIPIRAALLLVLLAILLQPAKLVYRRLAWEDASRRVDPSVTLSAERWGQAFAQAWTHNDDTENVQSLTGRLDELTSIAATFALTPKRIPRDEGKQWRLIPLSVVPRILWHNKPNYTVAFNDRYNITFGFQTEQSTKWTTSCFTIIADGWWNFGWPGIVFVGSVLGVMMGLFCTMFDVRSWGSLSLAACYLFLLNPRTDLAAQFDGLIQNFFAILVVCWLFRILSLGTFPRLRSRTSPHPSHAPATRRQA